MFNLIIYDLYSIYNVTNPEFGYNKINGATPTDEVIEKMRQVQLDRPPVSEETRRKLSESGKGRTSFWKGKHLSDEHKQKLSESTKGRKMSKEFCEKVSKAKTGILHPNTRPVLIDGIPYTGVRRASEDLNLDRRKVYRYLKSEEYPNYFVYNKR